MVLIDHSSNNDAIPSFDRNYYVKELKKLNDDLVEGILYKIDNNIITCDDINDYILQCLTEAAPESLRDRIRRRTTSNRSKLHLDDDEHQKLSLPTFADRVQPKRANSNGQMRGRGKVGHNHSTDTQRRNARLAEAIDFINDNIGKKIDETDLNGLNRNILLRIANKYNGSHKEWFVNLANILRG